MELGDPAEVAAVAHEEATAALVVGSGENRRRECGGLLDRLLATPRSCCVTAAPWAAAQAAARSRGVVWGVRSRADPRQDAHTAAALANALGGRLILVHALDRGGGTPLPDTEQRRASKLLARVREHLPDDVACELCIECGDPAERLAAVAASIRAGALVVGAPLSRAASPSRGMARQSLALSGRPVVLAPPAVAGVP